MQVWQILECRWATKASTSPRRNQPPEQTLSLPCSNVGTTFPTLTAPTVLLLLPPEYVTVPLEILPASFMTVASSGTHPSHICSIVLIPVADNSNMIFWHSGCVRTLWREERERTFNKELKWVSAAWFLWQKVILTIEQILLFLCSFCFYYLDLY